MKKKIKDLIFIQIATYQNLKLIFNKISMKKKILIVAGDPESINSEIIFKSWRQLSKTQKKDFRYRKF